MKIKALIAALFILAAASSAQAAAPCVTNFTIVITYDVSSAVLYSSPGCTPSHPSQSVWNGACILASGNSCTNLTGGSTLSIDLGYVTPNDFDVGYVYVRCTNGHVQAHNLHIIIPAGHQKADFKFYAECDAISTCDDAICVSPQ